MSKNLLQRCLEAVSPSQIFSAKPTLVSRRTRKSPHTFESLEDRKMLATVTVDAGVMTINGTDNRDVVVLVQNNDGTFDLDDDGAITNYNNSDVDSVVFRGKNGNDEFINNTFIPSSFYGHGGDDLFYGGVAADQAWGGGGNDELHGGIGDDTLRGGDGDDSIYGEENEDTIFGGNGNDRIYGGSENDWLSAEDGDDIMYGGDGNDFLRGYTGNDTIHGDAGEDLVYGQAGDDLIYGGDGNDRLRGNNDNDTIHGQLGDDVLIGDVGDDVFYGGDGNEIIYGWIGNDILNGENGDDLLYDGAGDDQLNGGNGNDVLRSGAGNDILKGGDGSDTLRGEDGNDLLYGGALLDRLYGGDGDDSLHGGEGTAIDQVRGEGGSDRFHQDDADNIVDRVAEDVTIRYETTFVTWNDNEVEVLDRAFRKIYDSTSSNVLLRETHDVSDDLTIYKYQDLPGTTTSDNVINSETNQREIHIVDFDETTDIGQAFFEAEILKQVGKNWDSPAELATGLTQSQADTQWQAWLDISQWTSVDPQDNSFTLSGDGQWWFLETTSFADFPSEENPYMDFVGTWSARMDNSFSGGLQTKIDWFNETIALM